MTTMRYTVAAADGVASFSGPCHALKMLVAGCAKEPATLRELLEHARCYDERFVASVLSGLAVFDEHNLPGDTSAIERLLASHAPADWPPFRVYDDVTRRASTQPGRAGLIVFNLNERRIVQVQNSWAEIQRRDRGRVRQDGRPTRTLYHYQLPAAWALVP